MLFEKDMRSETRSWRGAGALDIVKYVNYITLQTAFGSNTFLWTRKNSLAAVFSDDLF